MDKEQRPPADNITMTDTSALDAYTLISPEDDRRTFRRYALQMLAFIRLPEIPHPTACDSSANYNELLYTLQPVPVKDISMTGLFFFSKLPYSIGTEVEVRLCLNGKEYDTVARIERRVRVDHIMCGFGVRFLQSQVSKPMRVALAAYILRLINEKKAKECP